VLNAAALSRARDAQQDRCARLHYDRNPALDLRESAARASRILLTGSW
jgi:hypothetical protein